MTTALIVGCGYLGRRAGTLLAEQGMRVFGTVRTADRAAELPAWGIDPFRADVLRPESLAGLPPAELVLYSVGYDASGGAARSEVHTTGLRAVLDRLAGRVGRLVYASSTGVYGQDDGRWVDEESPAEPRGEGRAVLAEAEAIVREFAASGRLDAVVLRFAGLYGPGRIIRRALLERGEPIPGDPDHWLNLIHIDDAARFAVAALRRPAPSRIYNACDDRPVVRREFYGLLAALLKAPAPRFAPPDPAAGPIGRDAANKRVSNRRIKAELDLVCTYPDITTGLPAALDPGWRDAPERHPDDGRPVITSGH